MTVQDPRFALEEYREQVLAILRLVGQIRALDDESIEVVECAETIPQLIASINNAIIHNGIGGIAHAELFVLKGKIRDQYPS
jgi:hypothetical protein